MIGKPFWTNKPAAVQEKRAGSAGTGEEVRLPHLVGGERVSERPHDPLLTDHLVEVLGPVLPVEGGHAPSKAEVPGRASVVETCPWEERSSPARARQNRGT